MLRWIQSGIFQPRFTINSPTVTTPSPSPGCTGAAAPGSGGLRPALQAAALPVFPDVRGQRDRYARHAAPVPGVPGGRELLPRDKNLTFMFGPALLVANVVEKGATERTVRSARRKQVVRHERFSWREYEGGQTITVPVTPGLHPHVPSGAAPFCVPARTYPHPQRHMKQLDLTISAETDNSFVFYDDDGHTQDFQRACLQDGPSRSRPGTARPSPSTRRAATPERWERLTLKVVSKEKGAFWVSVDASASPGSWCGTTGRRRTQAGTTTCPTARSGSSAPSPEGRFRYRSREVRPDRMADEVNRVAA